MSDVEDMLFAEVKDLRAVEAKLRADITTAQLRITGLEMMLCDSERALAAVTAERDGLRHNWHQAVQDGTAITAALATERAAHEERKDDLIEMTEKWRRACDSASHQELLKLQAQGPAMADLARKAEELTKLLRSSPCKQCESTRTALSTAEARVKELEERNDQLSSHLAHIDGRFGDV